MEKEFVKYHQALRLKELGFDEPCFGFYDNGYLNIVNVRNGNMFKTNNGCLAPTFSQAFRWFREKYPDLDFAVGKIHNGTNNYHYHINLTWDFFEGTYEEAELACLDKLIEIVETKSE